MATDTQELLVFHAVVRHASYAKAADELAKEPDKDDREIVEQDLATLPI